MLKNYTAHIFYLFIILFLGVDIQDAKGQCSGLYFSSFSTNRTTFGQPDNNSDGLPDESGSLNTRRISYKNLMVGDQFAATYYGQVYSESESLPQPISITGAGTYDMTIKFDRSVGRWNNCFFPNRVVFDNGCEGMRTACYGSTLKFTPDYATCGGPLPSLPFTIDFQNGLVAHFDESGNVTVKSGWEYGMVQSYINNGHELVKPVSATITVKDKDTGNSLSCDKVPVGAMQFNSSGTLLVSANYSAAALAAAGCSDFANFSFDHYDVVTVVVNYEVVGNIGPAEKRLDFKNEFFLSASADFSNENKLTCSTNSSRTTDYVNVYGYHFESNLATKYDIKTCEVTLKQDYLFCIGNIWAAADFWPYEYRSWGRIKEATLELPEGYEIMETNLKQYRSLYRGWFDVENQNEISPDDFSNNKHTFKLDQYHKGNGGNINVSNNTFIGYITMKVSAATAQKSEDYKEAKWGFSFYQDDLIGGGVTGPHPGISYLKKVLSAQMEAEIQKPDLANGYPLTTSVNIKSTGDSDINDVKVYVEIPNNQSIVIEPGSVEFEYPAGSGFISMADPQMENGMYTINLADALPAQTANNRNQINVRFNLEPQDIFESGDAIKIKASSHAGCEEVVSTIEESFDFEHHFDHTLLNLDEEGYNSWGFSWGDYDNDGFPDLFVTNYEVDQPNRLYHNNGDGSFALVSIAPFTNDLASSLGSTWGDYDNDGDIDLYVSNNIGFNNFLYRNNGNGTFTSIKEDPVVNYLGYSHGVSWVDYDNDGYLDMFIADFFATKFNLLYRNNGDGTFTQNTTAAIVREAASTTTGLWADYDNDGDQDVFISNTNMENNSLYRNDGNGNFTRITDGAIVNDAGSSTGGSWGDIDNDGDLDLFVSNSGGQDNFLYMNNGDGTFTKETSGVIVNEGGHSHGSSFGDYDNDGDLDLVVANDNSQLNFFYINQGDGTFESSDLEVGLTRYPRQRTQIRNAAYNSFAVGWADIDNDGDLDLYVANHGNNDNCLLINQGGNYRNSACLNFEGLSSNIAAIGAKISVKANVYGRDVWQTREITGQTGGGISAQNELEQHFGLGDADMIDTLIIVWPSGYTQIETKLPVDNCLTIPEEAGATVSGVAFYDENGDCEFNAGERLLSNIEIIIEPTGQTVYTNNNGEYSITLPLGKYQLSQNNSGNWIHQCNGEARLPELALDRINTTIENINFPSQASGNCKSVDLNVAAASTALRVGFSSLLAYTLTNNGVEDATNVEVGVDFGGVVTPTSASVPWSSNSGSAYYWSLDDIEVGESVTIYVSTEVDASATIGDEIVCTIKTTSSEVDCNEDNNVFQERVTLVGAIDPNDILVDPEGPIASSDILNYKIRFQNVGTFEADRVVVENTLPEGLDLSTLEIGSVSHTYRFHIKDERTLVWEFENINLPDSISNEPESHGFVNYRIRPNSGLENGTTIENQAEIYFDFNEPIITNTVQNIIQDIAPGRGGLLNIFPNPVATQTSIEIVPKDLSLKQVQIKSISIYNSIGQLMVRDKSVDAYRYRMYQVDLAQGYYVVKIIGEDNNEYTGRMIIQN